MQPVVNLVQSQHYHMPPKLKGLHTLDPAVAQAVASTSDVITSVPSAYPLTVHNLICAVRTDVSINVALAAELLGGKLAPSKFPAAMCYGQLPTGTSVVFANGNLQQVGTHHISDAILSIHLLVRSMYLKMGIFPRLHHFKKCNVVCSVSLGHWIDVARLALENRTRCVYNPETFEGCHFTIQRDPFAQGHTTTFVIFRTGCIIITGGTSREAHVEDFKKMLPILRAYRCETQPATVVRRRSRSSRMEPLPRIHIPEAECSLSYRLRYYTHGVVLPPVISSVSKRVVVTEHFPEPRFFAFQPGVGGCKHMRCEWSDEEVPKCLTCGNPGKPYTFRYSDLACEHNSTWTSLPGRDPQCDLCGLLNADDEFYSRCMAQQKRKAERRERSKRKKADAARAVSDARSTGSVIPAPRRARNPNRYPNRNCRYKPVIKHDVQAPPGSRRSRTHTQAMGDPRQLAEKRMKLARLEHQMQSK